MRKIMMAAAISLAALASTIPANAQEGAVGGAVVGGVTGGLIFGPVGAVVGGVTGAVVGDNIEARGQRCWVNRNGRQVCAYR